MGYSWDLRHPTSSSTNHETIISRLTAHVPNPLTGLGEYRTSPIKKITVLKPGVHQILMSYVAGDIWNRLARKLSDMEVEYARAT